ncbi:hypothetical protein [Pseudoprimorskyibacter insulae]|uniref:hypothetical protein n=1 Tax=Pseudoprimorskyibacter insulae TaxID=1695997 RepID=UPI000D552CEA|nr:hypothetical protein [Pseudoprimorskyibacter insulae]
MSDLEREWLEQFRATPAYETHLTPTGSIAKEVRRDVEDIREARIKHITKRLDAQKTRARDGFNRSR